MGKQWYDAEEDVLNINISDGEYWKSIEVSPGIHLDVSEEGKILSVEILEASEKLSDIKGKLIESKVLTL